MANRPQTHECENGDLGRATHFLGIFVSNFLYVFAVTRREPVFLNFYLLMSYNVTDSVQAELSSDCKRYMPTKLVASSNSLTLRH